MQLSGARGGIGLCRNAHLNLARIKTKFNLYKGFYYAISEHFSHNALHNDSLDACVKKVNIEGNKKNIYYDQLFFKRFGS